MTPTKQESRTPFYKSALGLAVAGGVAFWVTNFLISLTPIAAMYRAALSISYLPMVLVESLVGGLVIGFCVGYFLLRFFEKIPNKESNSKIRNTKLLLPYSSSKPLRLFLISEISRSTF